MSLKRNNSPISFERRNSSRKDEKEAEVKEFEILDNEESSESSSESEFDMKALFQNKNKSARLNLRPKGALSPRSYILLKVCIINLLSISND